MRRTANPFPDHNLVDAAIAWVDAAVHSLDTEDVPLRTARGRVLTRDILAGHPIPSSDRAALDGFAVLANASLGASGYNPVQLPLIALVAGDALPAETDAVVPLELAEPDSQGWIEMVEAVAAGDNVEHQGAIATTGATLVPAGTRVAARHIGLLTSAGLSEVPVVRRPRVRILIAKPAKAGTWEDSNGNTPAWRPGYDAAGVLHGYIALVYNTSNGSLEYSSDDVVTYRKAQTYLETGESVHSTGGSLRFIPRGFISRATQAGRLRIAKRPSSSIRAAARPSAPNTIRILGNCTCARA